MMITNIKKPFWGKLRKWVLVEVATSIHVTHFLVPQLELSEYEAKLKADKDILSARVIAYISTPALIPIVAARLIEARPVSK